MDLIREAVRVALQDLIELEATEVIGAARYERSETRTTERNGSRRRVPTAKAGDVQHVEGLPSVLVRPSVGHRKVVQHRYLVFKVLRADPLWGVAT